MHTVVVGAGMAGLGAAIDLAARGASVTLLERAGAVGGKMRVTQPGGARIDAGPTVLTMRWVFDELLAGCGRTLGDLVRLEPLDVLARHVWGDGARLDLHADLQRSADAVGRFSGKTARADFLDFHERSARIYEAVEGPFIRGARPGVGDLLALGGRRAIRTLRAIDGARTMWSALSARLADPRLRQLFARYATYTGSSPMQAPATLNLVAHVEQSGVWGVRGGMHVLARSLAGVARELGVRIRCGAHVEGIDVQDRRVRAVRLADGEILPADAVIHAAGLGALRMALDGRRQRGAVPRPGTRSLSALTWSVLAETHGSLPLTLHNVFFSDDYAAEFEDLFDHRRLPRHPTVYVCAQDRLHGTPQGAERPLCLTNAPAVGRAGIETEEIDRCETATFEWMARCGLTLKPVAVERTTPMDFERLFPGSDGALYGAATHGWRAPLARPGARTQIAGLFLAGGDTHPGAGVPMATLSGRRAAEAVRAASPSTTRSLPGATRGGTSTSSTRSPASA